MNQKKNKKNQTTVMIIAGIVLVAVVAAILIVNAVRNRNSASPDGGAASDEDAVEVIPYGDDESDDYDFSGDYFDIATRNGSMTIEKDGSDYTANITYAEDDSSITVWNLNASYDKSRKALYYHNATRTDFQFGDDEASGVTSNEVYTDGTGYIYLSNENLFWIDEKEDMGAGMLFQKIDAQTVEEGLDTEAETVTQENADAAASEEAGAAESTEETGGEAAAEDVTNNADDGGITDMTLVDGSGAVDGE